MYECRWSACFVGSLDECSLLVVALHEDDDDEEDEEDDGDEEADEAPLELVFADSLGAGGVGDELGAGHCGVDVVGVAGWALELIVRLSILSTLGVSSLDTIIA